MKQFVTIFLSAVLLTSLSHAMTRVETSSTGSDGAKLAAKANQGGKVDAIFAGARKIVIGGVAYTYNPLTTVVMVNGKRGTISDVRTGDAVQFQVAPPQGASKAALLATLNVERR